MKIRPLSSLAHLSPEQIELLADLLQTQTYAQVRRALSESGTEISVSVLQRFYQRACERRELDESSESSAFAKAYLQFAVTGQTPFEEATLELVKKRLFETILANRDEELPKLKTLAAIHFKAKDVAVRERQVAVREHLAALKTAAVPTPAEPLLPRPLKGGEGRGEGAPLPLSRSFGERPSLPNPSLSPKTPVLSLLNANLAPHPAPLLPPAERPAPQSEIPNLKSEIPLPVPASVPRSSPPSPLGGGESQHEISPKPDFANDAPEPLDQRVFPWGIPWDLVIGHSSFPLSQAPESSSPSLIPFCPIPPISPIPRLHPFPLHFKISEVDNRSVRRTR